jgi:hypothetical protein
MTLALHFDINNAINIRKKNTSQNMYFTKLFLEPIPKMADRHIA